MKKLKLNQEIRTNIIQDVIVYGCCILFIVIGAIYLVRAFVDYKQADSIYEELTQEYTSTNSDEETEYVDLQALAKINNELVGWIRIENTLINYPVVKTSDNKKYLKTAFDKSKSNSGCIFMDYRCDGRWTSLVTMLHGHNMKNGTMFHTLHSYRSYAYYKEHPFIKVFTFYGIKEYQVLGACVCVADDPLYDIEIDSSEEYIDYLTHLDNISFYDTEIEYDNNKRILLLSTCYGKNDRFVVFAQEK